MIAAALSLSSAASGWTKQPSVPLPRLKPTQLQAPAIPLPKLKPARLIEQAPTKNVVPPADESMAKAVALNFPKTGVFESWSSSTLNEERSLCAKRLKGLDVKFEAMAPFGKQGGCGAAAALKVTHIAGVAIVPAGEFTCDMTEALHGWLTSSVVPAARDNLKKRIVKINNASAYVCRRRNNASSGKLSEHAKANALDIATLGFEDGSSTSIKGDWSGVNQMVGLSSQGNFLRRIRRDACIRFTTVLGPGSDPFHGDHFHIDVARRNSGYRICK